MSARPSGTAELPPEIVVTLKVYAHWLRDEETVSQTWRARSVSTIMT